MLRPRANQAKIATEDGAQLAVAARAGSTVMVHSGVLMIDGDDTMIFASGTVESNTDLTGGMPYEASGGFVMQPSDDPWLETAVGEGLVIKSGNGADINGVIRWTYGSV